MVPQSIFTTSGSIGYTVSYYFGPCTVIAGLTMCEAQGSKYQKKSCFELLSFGDFIYGSLKGAPDLPTFFGAGAH